PSPMSTTAVSISSGRRRPEPRIEPSMLPRGSSFETEPYRSERIDRPSPPHGDARGQFQRKGGGSLMLQ
ncbi:MAG: hypothetical protein ACREP9_13800, partial [Candidatus Dormibacteraceae bacterium]